MFSQVVLVGRIAEIDIDGHFMTINIARAKEKDRYDSIKVDFSEYLSKNACGYLNKNAIVGVKGTLKSEESNLMISAQSISFLSSGDGNQ